MSDTHREHPLPLNALLGAVVLITGSIVATLVGRQNDIGVTHMPVAQEVFSRSLRFEDRSDGAVVVFDVNEQREIAVFQPGTNGFLRGVMRGMARDRRSEGIDATPPFRLTRWSDGRMSILDPSTGLKLNLEVFGPTNAEPFAQLLNRDVPATEI